MKVIFCTYFDDKYLSRGLSFYNSLWKGIEPELWVLCLNDKCYEALNSLNLKSVVLVKLAELEALDPDLKATKTTRNIIEYYWTCGPSWILHVMARVKGSNHVIYADADQLLLAEPHELLDELKYSSVGIHGHNFTHNTEAQEQASGKYNVGFIYFKCDIHAKECLQWWRDKCIEWCYLIEEKDRFGDQKYLDQWPIKFKNVHIIQHPGVGVATWNMMRPDITCSKNNFYINGRPVIVAHFHGVHILTKGILIANIGVFSRDVLALFIHYAKSLQDAEDICLLQGIESPAKTKLKRQFVIKSIIAGRIVLPNRALAKLMYKWAKLFILLKNILK